MSDLVGRVTNLLAEYAASIDENRLEDWVELFAEAGSYRVVPRENHDQGLPVPLILCRNKKMIRDRIKALRNANEYNLHHDLHIIGAPRVVVISPTECSVRASYVVYQTTLEGQSRLFSVGRYEDRVQVTDDRLLFLEKLVIVDSFSVPTLLATPL